MNTVHYAFAAILTAAFVLFCIFLIYRLIRGTVTIGEPEDEPEYIEDDLNEYFFLYADSPRYPYKSGWTRILAPDLNIAHKVFSAFHPEEIEGLTNCAAVYDGDSFRRTSIFTTGNYGEYEHETITASRMTIEKKEVTPCRQEL